MNSPKDYRPKDYSFPSLPSMLAAERVLRTVLGHHVYVGGACVGFYVDDPGAAEIRPTTDVDVVVEVSTDLERAQLDKRLRQAGLQNDIEGPICRWKLEELRVDVMPTDPQILGFSNRWYAEALSRAIPVPAGELTLDIADVCTFIATKIDAFSDRGNKDFIASPDFEDIIRILDGCSFLETESRLASVEVQRFVGSIFATWRDSREFSDAVAAHLLDAGDGERRWIVDKRIESLVGLAGC